MFREDLSYQCAELLETVERALDAFAGHLHHALRRFQDRVDYK